MRTLRCITLACAATLAAGFGMKPGCFDDDVSLRAVIRDPTATCLSAKKEGYCTTHAPLAKKYCPVSCGLCTPGGASPTAMPTEPAAAPPSSAPTSAVDARASNSFRFVGYGNCLPELPQDALWTGEYAREEGFPYTRAREQCLQACYTNSTCVGYDTDGSTCRLRKGGIITGGTGGGPSTDTRCYKRTLFTDLATAHGAHGSCANGGQVLIVSGLPACSCAPGFSGVNCETKASTSAPTKASTKPLVCQNGATSITLFGVATCSCTRDFVGAECTISAPRELRVRGFLPSGACPASRIDGTYTRHGVLSGRPFWQRKNTPTTAGQGGVGTMYLRWAPMWSQWVFDNDMKDITTVAWRQSAARSPLLGTSQRFQEGSECTNGVGARISITAVLSAAPTMYASQGQAAGTGATGPGCGGGGSTCANGGTCHKVQLFGREVATCHCTAGWSGADCLSHKVHQNTPTRYPTSAQTTQATHAACNKNGHGTWAQATHLGRTVTHYCHCLPGWTGANCETRKPAAPTSQPTATTDSACFTGPDACCKLGAATPACFTLFGGAKCACASGWSGPKCDYNSNTFTTYSAAQCLNGLTTTTTTTTAGGSQMS